MSASFRFPGHPAPLTRQTRLNPWGDVARPMAQTAKPPAAGVGRDLFDEVIANIHGIIRGELPVRAA